jgi:iron complex transport system substrate-binding protein
MALLVTALAALLTLALTACGKAPADDTAQDGAQDAATEGQQVEDQKPSEAVAFPLTLDNYAIPAEGGTWQHYEVTFDEAPQRIVANTQAAAEFLIKLGLGDRIVGVGALYGEVEPDVKDEFDKLTVLSQAYLTQEQTLGAEPDLVFGRGDVFNATEYGVGSVENLNRLGIKTYLMHSTRDGATLKDLYRDIDEMSALFGVEDVAQAFKAELETRVKALVASYGGAEEKDYCFLVPTAEGSYSIFAGPRMSMQEELLESIGLVSVASDIMMTVSDEQLVGLDPDVILILAYTGVDSDAARDGLLTRETLQTVRAVEDKAVFALDFSKSTYSFRVIDEMERVAPLIHVAA